MAKKTVQDLILQQYTQLNEKMDRLLTETVPGIQTAIAVSQAEAKVQAKTTAKIHGAIWGGLTLAVSLVGVAVAYFKH